MKITLSAKELSALVLGHIEEGIGLPAGSLKDRTIQVQFPGGDDEAALSDFAQSISVDVSKKK